MKSVLQGHVNIRTLSHLQLHQTNILEHSSLPLNFNNTATWQGMSCLSVWIWI